MNTNKTYSISNKIQLIDLNHDMINFRVEFLLSSSNPFYALIIDQHTLDNTEIQNIEFRRVETSLSGEVVSDKNIYQNYYIILKSEQPTDVNIQLHTTPLPDFIPPPEHPIQQQPPPVQQQPPPIVRPTVPVSKSYLQNKYVRYGILLLLVCLILYYLYSKKTKSSSRRSSLLAEMKM